MRSSVVRNPPIPEAKVRVLSLFTKTSRPVLIGQASLELRWPLSWVEELFEELRHEGKIRLLSPSESYQYDVKHGFFRCT